MVKVKRHLLRSRHHNSLLYFVVLILLLAVQTFHVKAQNFRWSAPKKIPLYPAEMIPPILVADKNRTVHAFSSQVIDDTSSEAIRDIVYNQWTLERGWTTPIDIILSPNKEARVTDVFLDDDGIFHLLFFGGDQLGADIYYTTAPAADADDSRAWSIPFIIGENAGDPEGAVFAKTDQGALYVVYVGRELGRGLYVVNSVDGGETWSEPTPIFFTDRDEPYIFELQIIESESGWLHAIWAVNNESNQGRGIYYARSKDGIDWSEAVLLADATDGFGTRTPAIIEYNDSLLALYNLPGKIKMRRSNDGGVTWDDPFNIFPRHVGVNGSLSLVIDGNNVLHLFFGQRITGSPDIHGMWHSKFINNRWIEPDAVVKGPRIVDVIGGNGFDPNFARAVVSQGNLILLTWMTDPGAGRNGIWYSYKQIDAPELPTVELPTNELRNINSSVVTESPKGVAPTAILPSSDGLEDNRVIPLSTSKPVLPNNPSFPILIGSILALVLVLILVIALQRTK